MLPLPDDLLRDIDEYLLPSREHVRELFSTVLKVMNFVFDDDIPVNEILSFIKFGLEQPVLQRQTAHYSRYHYLHEPSQESGI
jgi:hypothetical protein